MIDKACDEIAKRWNAIDKLELDDCDKARYKTDAYYYYIDRYFIKYSDFGAVIDGLTRNGVIFNNENERKVQK